MTTLLDDFRSNYSATQNEEMGLEDYLALCKREPAAYATAAERMLAGIGEPEQVDTRNDPRLARIFGNRVIRRYPAFGEFFGMEEAIEQIVAFFKHAAQGLEERKQILYLLGPVGGGKSSIAERLKAVMEKHPIYAIKGSPVNESPLGLFAPERFGAVLESDYGIPRRYLHGIMSPWAVKRLEEFGGDLSRFRVVRIQPSVLRQVAITKTEPGDDNNQDISSLVGKVDIRQLEHLSQNDPDAYSYSGGLCLANQGLLEFVEMFKAPIKMLHPLLTATQEGNFKGTEGFSAIPVQRRHRRALERVGVAQLPQQQEQRGVPRPHLHRQGAVLRARVRGSQDLPEAPDQLVARGRSLRAGHARDDGAVLRPHPAEGAREFEHLFQDARLRRRDAEGRRSQGQDAAGIPRLRRHGRRHDGHVDALRLQDPVRGVQPRPDRDRRQPGASHVRPRAAARPRGPAGRSSAAAASST